jgi:hypothetical protein
MGRGVVTECQQRTVLGHLNMRPQTGIHSNDGGKLWVNGRRRFVLNAYALDRSCIGGRDFFMATKRGLVGISQRRDQHKEPESE